MPTWRCPARMINVLGGWTNAARPVNLTRPILEPPMKTRHVLTILAVDDVPSNADFYRSAFGWRASVETAVYVEFELEPDRRIGLYERESFSRNTLRPASAAPAGSTSSTELYFHVDDIERAMDRLQRAGAVLLSAPSKRAWGDRAAYFADPSGNVIVVAELGRDSTA